MIWVPVLVFGFVGFLAGIAVFGLLVRDGESEAAPAKSPLDADTGLRSPASSNRLETAATIATFAQGSSPSPLGSTLAAETENLLQKQIAQWGSSTQVSAISQISTYLGHDDPAVRSQAAAAIAQIATRLGARREVLAAIPELGKLTGDRVPSVRQAAVVTLGDIRSRAAKSWLQKAMHDPDLKVSSTARRALARFAYDPKPAKRLNSSSKILTRSVQTGQHLKKINLEPISPQRK